MSIDRQLELRKRARSVVVEINASLPVPTSDKPDAKEQFFMMGTIVVAEPEFCYVVVKRNLIRAAGSYEVCLPDGSSMEMSGSEFSISQGLGLLAGFYVYRKKLSYDINKVAAIDFGDDAVTFDEVHLCDFSPGLNLDVRGGHVINANDNDFMHDCARGRYTANGAPVFYKDGKLAGLCMHNVNGPLMAFTVTNIKQNLMMIYETETLQKFFEKVQELKVQQ